MIDIGYRDPITDGTSLPGRAAGLVDDGRVVGEQYCDESGYRAP